KSIKLSFNENNHFISFDIEAYKHTNKEFIPNCCGWYDGSNSNMYYVTDFESPVEMIAKAFTDIANYINSGKNYSKKHVVYAHNLGHFDGLYIIEALHTIGVCNPLIKDKKIVQVDFSVNCKYNGRKGGEKERKIRIKLYDSYQLIPVNLKTLAEDFNCDTQKGIFPYDFVNQNNLNYVGPVPPLSTFNDLDDFEYMKLVNNYKDNWSLRNECLKYCECDIKALYEILASFSKEIFNEYNLNITKYPTASSLAMGIFRGHNLDEDKSRIPLLTGHIHSEIRSAYYGGAVETYIPYIKKGYHYDVNSLFPAAMKGDMPVGNYIYTTEQDLNKIFGFSFVRVETPLNLKVPLLPYRDENKVIYPVGSWYGMYYTEILKDVVKYGYKITIIYSINFEKHDLFSEYVDKLYKIKANSTGTRRTMAKLLLNSLYGRFGLKEFIDKTVIVSKEKAEELYALYEIKEAYPLKDGYELIVYTIKPDLDNIQVLEYKKEAAKILSGLELGFNDYNSSIAIAAAITA